MKSYQTQPPFRAARHPSNRHLLLHLQRAAGNRAVAGAMRQLRREGQAGSVPIHGAMLLQREPDAGAPAATAVSASPIDQVIEALGRADPVAGVGDYPRAWRILNGLNITGILATLTELQARSQLDVLASATGQMAGVNQSRLLAALYAVQLARGPVTSDLLIKAATEIQQLPADQRDEVLRHLASRGGAGDVAQTMEGVAAILEGASPSTTVPPEVLRQAAAAVGPGPWVPPGRQAIGFYIGNSAHIGIAAEYVAAHLGQAVFTNVIPMSTILASLRINPAVLGADAGLRPDIANVSPSKRHIYEIKPSGSENVAVAEAMMYAGLFARAGYPMSLGMPGEPGTSGIVPAPAGYYMFYCLTPGAISYKYRRGSFDPQRAPQREEQDNDIRLRLPPLSQQQVAVIATTTTATIMMIILAIILAPVGA